MGTYKTTFFPHTSSSECECQGQWVCAAHPICHDNSAVPVQTQLSWLLAVVSLLAECVIVLRAVMCLLYFFLLLYFPLYFKNKALLCVLAKDIWCPEWQINSRMKKKLTSEMKVGIKVNKLNSKSKLSQLDISINFWNKKIYLKE